jgi:hypothetical protein
MELKDHLGGHFLANKLRATVDGKLVILARLEGEKWVFTDVGHREAAKANAAKPAQPAKTKATRKSAKAVVESQKDSD